MAKRQKYSVKESDALLRPRNYPSSIADHGKPGEPQCSYMYGGLADLRREGYPCRSPLKTTPRKDSAKKGRESCAECFDATAAAVVFPPAAGIKINPLLARSSRDDGTPEAPQLSGEEEEEVPVFYGQRTKIRRTKDQEMMTAILEVTGSGTKRSRIKRKLFGGKKGKKRGGPFILRPHPQPLKNHNT